MPLVSSAVGKEEDQRQGYHDMPATVHVLVVAGRLDQGKDQHSRHGAEHTQGEPDGARPVCFQHFLSLERSDYQGNAKDK